MSARRLLPSQYRSFLRILNTFNREGIPLVTVPSVSVDTDCLDTHAAVRTIFRSQQAISPTSASAALARLKHQLDILLHAEDHTREVKLSSCKFVRHGLPQQPSQGSCFHLMQAFRTWQSLVKKYGQVQLLPPTVCSAIEDTALALPDLASGEPAWSVEDILGEATGKSVTHAHQQASTPDLGRYIISHISQHLLTSWSRAARKGG